MWSDKFSTPPPTWRNQRPLLQSPMSERMAISTPPPNNKDDLFHVIHKVPTGDSPYVKAKHIQLIDKDPSRSIALFWAAINAGDRVDSALKDMAVVMKQLNRSDEAIEAIKSFRHLCPYESQESLDNVLVELYKRSGRIEEEIGMLQHKLKNIEVGKAFGGARTKIARSQGKKIQITIEQERSRILGNLAWAYLQQENYEMAEQHYRKALCLESDKNKQCNLAICLMHMNKVTEAKFLLQAVRTSAGNKEMDISYAKSYERAVEMLTELESQEQEEEDRKENRRPFESQPAPGKPKELTTSRSLADGHARSHLEHKDSLFGYEKGSSKGILSSGPRASSQFSPHTMFVGNQNKSNPCGRYDVSSTRSENWANNSPGSGVSSAHNKMYASPGAAAVRRNLEVPFTQPRRPSWGFNNTEQGRERWRDDATENVPAPLTQPRRSSDTAEQRRGKAVGSSIRKLSFDQAIATEDVQEHKIQNVNGKLLVSPEDKSEIRLHKSEIVSEVKTRTSDKSDTTHDQSIAGEPKSKQDCSAKGKKSWADMVEEEEENFNDENMNSNRIYPSSCPHNDLKNASGVSSRNPTVRRSLCFDHQTQRPESPSSPLPNKRLNFDGCNSAPAKHDQDHQSINMKRRNRLQVFQDITPLPDSP